VESAHDLRRQLASASARLAEQDRRIQRLLHNHESQRRVLARELHDQAGQSLAAIVLGLAAIERDLAVGATRAQVQGLRGRVSDTLRELRELAIELRPPALDELGLQPALQSLAARAGTRSGHRVVLVTSGLVERVPADLETTVYRLIDDLLDVLAASSDIYVELNYAPREIQIRIATTPSGPGGELILSQELLDLISARLDLAAGQLSLEHDGRHALVAHIPVRRPYESAPPAGAPPAGATPEGGPAAGAPPEDASSSSESR
jgi:signal transduction histidine kinase